MQYDCYVTMEMQRTYCYATGTITLQWKCNMVHRSCYQGKPNMSQYYALLYALYTDYYITIETSCAL
jgi:hypothetical protein